MVSVCLPAAATSTPPDLPPDQGDQDSEGDSSEEVGGGEGGADSGGEGDGGGRRRARREPGGAQHERGASGSADTGSGKGVREVHKAPPHASPPPHADAWEPGPWEPGPHVSPDHPRTHEWKVAGDTPLPLGDPWGDNQPPLEPRAAQVSSDYTAAFLSPEEPLSPEGEISGEGRMSPAWEISPDVDISPWRVLKARCELASARVKSSPHGLAHL